MLQCPFTPTPTPSYLWQMCATNIFMLEGVDHLVVGDFYSKMIFVRSFPPGQSNANKVVLMLKEMFAEHGIPKGPLLWQWPTICECPVCQLLYILGHNIQNLKSAIPTMQWICWGKHQVHQTCTPMSQIQQCQPTGCPDSTLSYTHQHQASISCRAVVPVLVQNNHSGQDMQQRPISYTSLWADQHTLRSCQITDWQMQQNICTTVCWSTSCNVWHPQKDLGSSYCWYMSYHRTAIKYAPAMVPHTATHVDTFVNAVSKQLTLSQVAQLPHCRLQLDTASQWHNLHCPHLHSACSPHLLTCKTGIPDEPGPSCSYHTSCSKECPGTNTMTSHATPVQPWRSCHACKAPRCLIQGNLRTLNPDCPQTLLL